MKGGGSVSCVPYAQTVLGPAEIGELGHCQCHEHLLLSKGKSYEVNHDLFMNDIDKSVEEVQRYKRAGGGTIVDAQPVGCGRIAEGLVRIAKETGIRLIASTGFHKTVFYPAGHWIFQKDEEWLTRLFIRECEEGMYADGDWTEPEIPTGAKAGMIKTALDVCGPVGSYGKLFKAAARAQRETGAPMMIHVEKGADAASLLDFLQDQGVLANRLLFCHLDRACADTNLHKKLGRAGCYLEYDTIGRFRYHSDETEGRLIREMIEAGLLHRILLSLDTTRARMRSYTPDGVGLDYILKVFGRILNTVGVTEEELRVITCENPKGALAVGNGENV